MDGREERGAQTREALVCAARRAFARRGFAGASVRDIAADAGAHPGLVRYHFGSKLGLYRHVVSDALDRMSKAIADSASRAESVDDVALAAIDGYLDHLKADPSFPFLVLRGILDRDPIVIEVSEDRLGRLWGLLRQLFSRDPLIDPDNGLLTLWGAAVIPYLYAPLMGSLVDGDHIRATRREHLHTLVRLILHGHP